MEKAIRIIKIIIAIVLIAALLIMLVTRLTSLLSVLILSAVLAYLLNKPLRALERKMKRPWALLIIFGILSAIVALFICYAVPLFFRQAADMVAFLPELIKAGGKLVDDAGKNAGEPLAGILRQAFDSFNKRAADWLGNATIALAQGGSSGIGWALLLPVFSFYFLKDHEYFTDQIGYLIPIKYRNDLHVLYVSIDKALGQFLRGQLVVAISVAMMTAAGLLIIGVPNALLLGLMCGFCNLIPYVGPLIGAIPVALVSLMLGWRMMLFSVLIVFVVQQLDNMIISPKIIGESLKIHPIYVIVAIVVGSGLLGAMGLLLALPGLIIIKEIILFLFRKRLYRNRNALPENEKS